MRASRSALAAANMALCGAKSRFAGWWHRFKAARWYSLMTPPRTRRRRIAASSGTTTVGSCSGGALAQALVRAVRVVVREVPVEDLPGVVLVDQHAVGALAADGLDEPFDVAVRLQRPGRDLHHLDALVSKDG